MSEFDGRVAFVTGAASGIGRALALAFARAGSRVMLADIEGDALDTAVGEVRRTGADARAVRCDVSSEASVEEAARRTVEAFGAVHIVCNNAGVIVGGRAEEIAERDWEWVLAVNLMGVVHGIRAFLPRMRSQGQGGYIVNTASGAGLFTPGMLGPYSASKFAVVGLSECLAAELVGTGVRVAVLCPSFVNTRIFDAQRNHPDCSERRGVEAPEKADPLSAMLPLLQSGMEPERVADRVLEALRAGEFYIFTHPEMRAVCEQRHANLIAAFESAERSFALGRAESKKAGA